MSEGAVERLERVMDAVLSAKPKKVEAENGIKEEAKEVMAPEME